MKKRQVMVITCTIVKTNLCKKVKMRYIVELKIFEDHRVIRGGIENE